MSFTVRVDGAPNGVEAFGFDVLYDPQALQYTGSFAPAEAARGFDFFNVSAPTPGRIRVGGFTTRQQLEAGRSGGLVTLEFQMRTPGAATLSLGRLVDDMTGWPTQAGRIEGAAAPASPSQPQDTVPQSLNIQTESAVTPPLRIPTQQRASELRKSPTGEQSSRSQGGSGALASPEQTSRPVPVGGAVPRPSAIQVESPTQPLQTAVAGPRDRVRGMGGVTREEPRPPTPHARDVQTPPPVAMGEQPGAQAPPQRVAQAGPTVSREAASRPAPAQVSSTAPANRSLPAEQGAPQPTGLFSQTIRVAIPLVTLVLLGVVIVVLVGLRGRE